MVWMSKWGYKDCFDAEEEKQQKVIFFKKKKENKSSFVPERSLTEASLEIKSFVRYDKQFKFPFSL